MSECEYCQSRRRFLGYGATLGLGLMMPSLSEAAGSMRQFSGDILVNGRPASAKTLIGGSAKVETRAGSSASFVVGNNAFLLRPDSVVHFTRSRRSLSAISGFRLISGAILGVFGPGPKKLVTKTATIGIRGTGVYFENRPQSSYICLCYGGIDLNANTVPDKLQQITAEHHDGREVSDSGSISASPMVNHTDDELVMLEALVGRKPPFVKS